MTTTELAPDPLIRVRRGYGIRDYPNYRDEQVGIWVPDSACHHPDGGVYCTRAAGHPEHWPHVGTDGYTVLRVWAGAEDPFKNLTPGDDASRDSAWQHPNVGVRHPDEDWCRLPLEGDRRFCTRVAGHSEQWAHVATNYSGLVLAVLPGIDPEAPYVETVPEDGSPADPEELVLTTSPDIGIVVKLRDRAHQLYVIGVRSGGKVEVLDLTEGAEIGQSVYRIIPLDHLVQSDVPLTPNHMTQVVKWFAEHREAVREVGIREMRAGRWCRPGLDEALREMGLPEFVPELRGEVILKVQFTSTDPHTPKSWFDERLERVLRSPAFREFFAVEGMTPDWRTSNIAVGNLHRG